MKNDRLVVLFSGGVHSSLAVALCAPRYKNIICLTLRRFGIFGARQVNSRLEALKNRFPRVKFGSLVLPVDDYYNTLFSLRRFNIMSLSVCGLCKLAMHWRAIEYCLRSGISEVCDGSEKSMIQYPDQNEEIMLGSIRNLYSDFNINYFTPVFNIGDKAEHYLFRLGVVPKKIIRGTKEDIQVVCTQQRLFKIFVDYYVLRNGWDRYVRDSRIFFEKKIPFIREALSKKKENDRSWL
ncbi:MAG: hypothetical protein PHX78_12045 [bacterium]|nr:hypothetical protein [bacterium]